MAEGERGWGQLRDKVTVWSMRAGSRSEWLQHHYSGPTSEEEQREVMIDEEEEEEGNKNQSQSSGTCLAL